MCTEQDTFDRLRRISFIEMLKIIRETNTRTRYRQGAASDALLDNGWTRADYINALDAHRIEYNNE